jgi:hypothetical protein
MAKKSKGQTSGTANNKGMTKAEAIRQAIRHLGKDAKPLELQAHIKDRFGIDITTDHISAAKTAIVRKIFGAAKAAPVLAAARTTTGPPPTAKKPTTKKQTLPTSTAKPAAGAASNGRASSSVALADIVAVKALVGRVGAANLKALIDVLAT